MKNYEILKKKLRAASIVATLINIVFVTIVYITVKNHPPLLDTRSCFFLLEVTALAGISFNLLGEILRDRRLQHIQHNLRVLAAIFFGATICLCFVALDYDQILTWIFILISLGMAIPRIVAEIISAIEVLKEDWIHQ